MKQNNIIRILKGGLENFAKDENFAKENVRHALLKEIKTFESRIGRKKHWFWQEKMSLNCKCLLKSLQV